MHKIIIACACNDAYSPYCGTMITSVFCNNREENIEVNILTSDIGEDNKKKFGVLASDYNQVINIVSLIIPVVCIVNRHMPFIIGKDADFIKDKI